MRRVARQHRAAELALPRERAMRRCWRGCRARPRALVDRIAVVDPVRPEPLLVPGVLADRDAELIPWYSRIPAASVDASKYRPVEDVYVGRSFFR